MDAKAMKIVIVGGVAGGATAAARLRRLYENAEITIYERSGYVSYANCGLPYFVGGTIKKKEALLLQTPASFKSRYDVEVQVLHEVLSIDRKAKEVTVKDLTTGKTFKDPYDKLILSPGAKPLVPPIGGMDLEGVFTLRTAEDSFRIRDYIESRSPKKAVVAGGGYIGIEQAHNLRDAGLDVTIVQKTSHLLQTIDPDIAAFVHAHVRSNGVNIVLNDGLSGLKKHGNGLVAVTEQGKEIACDFAIVSLGVRPETALAAGCGLELGKRGGIKVDGHMRTGDPDIYAVGDAAEITDLASGSDSLIALAGPANKEGRVAADNIAGIESVYRGSLASSVIKVFGLTLAMTGMTYEKALSLGKNAGYIVISPNDHAAYYPGAKAMTLKVVYDKDTGGILGAQAIGEAGVDKRIDVIATAMMGKIKASELKDLDLCYAPPYGSAKDPVNMAGFMIENIEAGLLRQFGYEECLRLPRDGSVNLVDVRTPYEYSFGRAEGFVNIPVDELRERLGEIDKTKPTYVMCQSAVRSYIACRILSQNGYECFNFVNGYRYYATLHSEEEISRAQYDCGLSR